MFCLSRVLCKVLSLRPGKRDMSVAVHADDSSVLGEDRRCGMAVRIRFLWKYEDFFATKNTVRDWENLNVCRTGSLD